VPVLLVYSATRNSNAMVWSLEGLSLLPWSFATNCAVRYWMEELWLH